MPNLVENCRQSRSCLVGHIVQLEMDCWHLRFSVTTDFVCLTNLCIIVIIIVTVGNLMVQFVEHEEERTITNSESSANVSSDCSNVPHLLRTKSSNCFRRTSGTGAEYEQRFFLPNIDRTGSVSAQRRPATSGEVRLNNERQVEVDDEVHRPPRASAVTVWNSLTSVPPMSNTSPADLTLQSVATGNFIPSPPTRKKFQQQ